MASRTILFMPVVLAAVLIGGQARAQAVPPPGSCLGIWLSEKNERSIRSRSRAANGDIQTILANRTLVVEHTDGSVDIRIPNGNRTYRWARLCHKGHNVLAADEPTVAVAPPPPPPEPPPTAPPPPPRVPPEKPQGDFRKLKPFTPEQLADIDCAEQDEYVRLQNLRLERLEIDETLAKLDKIITDQQDIISRAPNPETDQLERNKLIDLQKSQDKQRDALSIRRQDVLQDIGILIDTFKSRTKPCHRAWVDPPPPTEPGPGDQPSPPTDLRPVVVATPPGECPDSVIWEAPNGKQYVAKYGKNGKGTWETPGLPPPPPPIPKEIGGHKIPPCPDRHVGRPPDDKGGFHITIGVGVGLGGDDDRERRDRERHHDDPPATPPKPRD